MATKKSPTSKSRRDAASAGRNTLVRQRTALPTDFNAAAASLNCDSEAVREKIHRIQSNYLLLDQLLTDIEQKLPFADEVKQPKRKLPNKPR